MRTVTGRGYVYKLKEKLKIYFGRRRRFSTLIIVTTHSTIYVLLFIIITIIHVLICKLCYNNIIRCIIYSQCPPYYNDSITAPRVGTHLYRYQWCGKRRSENELYRKHNMFWNLSRVKAGLCY